VKGLQDLISANRKGGTMLACPEGDLPSANALVPRSPANA
jgi:hypothetical protein